MPILTNLIKRIPGSHAVYGLARDALQWVRVTREFLRFRSRSRCERQALIPQWRERQFLLGNRTAQTPFDRHYVYHTAWAMRQLQRYKPREHVDISSSLYFVALGSAVVPIRHFDFRPPLLFLDNLTCAPCDLMKLPFADNSVTSLSCMHVIEHIGLARYGDPLDPLGDVKGAKELTRVLAPVGRLLFVAPVGQARVCFNAHRIYDFESVRDLLHGLQLEEWALIPDDAERGVMLNPPPEVINAQRYGCGCFAFRKPA